MFLENFSVEDLGRFRKYIETNRDEWREIYDPNFNSLDIAGTGIKRRISRLISELPIPESKHRSLKDAIFKFPQEIFNFGFPILIFREIFKKHKRRLFFFMSLCGENHGNRLEVFERFLLAEFSLGNLVRAGYGSRYNILKVEIPIEPELSICIRKSVSDLDEKEINEERSREHKGQYKRAKIPPFSLTEQFKVHKRLYYLSKKEKRRNPKTALLPFPIFSDTNITVMEFLKMEDLLVYTQDKQRLTEEAKNQIYDRLFNYTFPFWEQMLFKHNDFHSRNCMIDPNNHELAVIDFDRSKFYENVEDFSDPVTEYIDGKVYYAEPDRDIQY